MADYKYLIVGGGMTADAAIHGIREVDQEGTIGLIGKETHPPYNRPLLTKGLWKDKRFDQIWRGTEDLDVTLHLGRVAEIVDADQKRVIDDQEAIYTFDKLLLATGGTPRRLPLDGEDIVYYRTVDDYQHLRAHLNDNERYAVIGGGFIGSEIAAALTMNGKQVVLLFPEEGIGGRRFPADLALFLNDYYREKGVDVLPGELVTNLAQRDHHSILITKKGLEVPVDSVLAGIGIHPNIELARAAGLKTDNGIIVDAFLRTSAPDVYAAGDVAAFYNPALDRRMRVEHEDNANTMGDIAGRNMAGDSIPYNHLPYFYSDLFDLGYEAVGDLNPQLDVVEDWTEPFRKGVVYYLSDGRVRGVLLWNVWGQVNAARRLISAAGPFAAGDLKRRLPE